MTWEPTAANGRRPRILAALRPSCRTAVIVFWIVTGLHGTSVPITYPSDDAIYPNGQKKDRDEIVRFMESARDAVGAPGARRRSWAAPDRVTCNTCHGAGAGAETPTGTCRRLRRCRGPRYANAGWENYGGAMDAQMRNAIYGYGAESDRASRAAYMREIVMPGMARLLGRPAYDFTQPYAFNRSHFAFGCYHCHKVK